MICSGDRGLRRLGSKGCGAVCFRLQGYGGKSVISLTEWWTVREKSPWMAILGAIRQDAALLRPVRLAIPTSIPLVKSDLETRPATGSTPPHSHFIPAAAVPYPRSRALISHDILNE
ncbi:MAG: hypothetical protein K2N15_13660 [Lachnospiraceae bacterium]|nr:hypothetical protein [Lachnospiraceae bacterium]